ncbi:MAG: histidinol-phosphatase [Sumerlaeia bacterium]
MNYVDYHNHTVICRHATGSIDEYLERATQLGIREFGFAEHSPWMIQVDERKLCPSEQEFDEYIQILLNRQQIYNGKNGKPLIKIGIEADWVPERLAEARAFIAKYPFDYVYGSVHHLPDPTTEEMVTVWHFTSNDWDSMYTRYFTAVGELVQSGMCDILAHLDVIRRSCKVPEKGVLPYLEPIIPLIKESGVAVEINASGRDHKNKDFFPCPEVLKRLIAEEVPITFGSDGHMPNHVGRYAADVVEYFVACGGKEYVRFEKREKIPTPIR